VNRAVNLDLDRFSIAARVGGGNALPDRDVNYFANGHAPPVVVGISLCEKYAERTKPPMKRRWAVSGRTRAGSGAWTCIRSNTRSRALRE
jgi:hypothetical protein